MRLLPKGQEQRKFEMAHDMLLESHVYIFVKISPIWYQMVHV